MLSSLCYTFLSGVDDCLIATNSFWLSIIFSWCYLRRLSWLIYGRNAYWRSLLTGNSPKQRMKTPTTLEDSWSPKPKMRQIEIESDSPYGCVWKRSWIAMIWNTHMIGIAFARILLLLLLKNALAKLFLWIKIAKKIKNTANTQVVLDKPK